MNKITLTQNSKSKSKLERGQLFLFEEEEGGEEQVYILAVVQSQYVLVNLNTGGFFTSPNWDIREAFSNMRHKFTRIFNPLTITPNND